MGEGRKTCLRVVETLVLKNGRFVPCRKQVVSTKIGESPVIAFYPQKQGILLLKPRKSTKMTKTAGVTPAKWQFAKSSVLTTLIVHDPKPLQPSLSKLGAHHGPQLRWANPAIVIAEMLARVISPRFNSLAFVGGIGDTPQTQKLVLIDPAFVVLRFESRDWRSFVQHLFHTELRNGQRLAIGQVLQFARLIAIEICDSNRDSQITSFLRPLEAQSSDLLDGK